MLRRVVSIVSLLVLSGQAVGAQEEQGLPTERRPATLAIQTTAGATESPLSTLVTPYGPLVPMTVLVERLGGELAPTGPQEQGFELELLGQKMIFGSGSRVVTVGQDIRPISQEPVILAGAPYVPVDLLTRTYGDALGYVFRWDAFRARLEVSRRPPRRIDVAADVVHLQGASTVVLQFSQRPRYTLEREDGLVTVEIVGDRLEARGRREREEDPFVDGIEIFANGVRMRFAAGVQVDHYTLERPFRLVFDLHRLNEAPEVAEEIDVPERDLPGTWTIVVDPGHGGSETGAIGPAGSAEKDLTLILAQSLAANLRARLPVRVLLTRDEDAELPLETRTALANQHGADLFVSLHLNASIGNRAFGAETYFLSLTASDEDAARTAALENLETDQEAADAEVEDLQLILWDLAQSYHMTESQRLANLIQRELNEALGLRDRGVRQAPFKVLMGATMPAVLVELGFITHPEEEERLHDPAHRQGLVEALTRAIARFRAQGEPDLARGGERQP